MEFINTERDYVRDLQILISVYIEGMREQKILSSQDLDSLFTSIEQLLPVHLDIMKALEARRNENPIIMNLGTLLSALQHNYNQAVLQGIFFLKEFRP